MEEAPVRFEMVDINDILKTLPHRYPMLLIDRVIKIRTDYSGIGIKNVTFNEPCFAGHFPERPVYPGVMMIEAMAQTAGVIGIKSVEGTEKPRAVYFLTIDKCKFRKPVMPGDTVAYHMRSIGRRESDSSPVSSNVSPSWPARIPATSRTRVPAFAQSIGRPGEASPSSPLPKTRSVSAPCS